MATESVATSVYPVMIAATRHTNELQAPATWHACFGVKAKRCRPTCTFSESHGMPTVSSIVANDTVYLLFITDSLSGRHFLCDTGAQVSVLPASPVDIRLGEVRPPLEAANQGTYAHMGNG